MALMLTIALMVMFVSAFRINYDIISRSTSLDNEHRMAGVLSGSVVILASKMTHAKPLKIKVSMGIRIGLFITPSAATKIVNAIPTTSNAGQPKEILQLMLFLLQYQPLLSQQDHGYLGQNGTKDYGLAKANHATWKAKEAHILNSAAEPKFTSFVEFHLIPPDRNPFQKEPHGSQDNHQYKHPNNVSNNKEANHLPRIAFGFCDDDFLSYV